MIIFYNLPIISAIFRFNEYIQNLNPINEYYRLRIQYILLFIAMRIIHIYSTLEIYFNMAKRNASSFFYRVSKSNPRINEFINSYNSNKKVNNLDCVRNNKINISINVKDALDFINAAHNPVKMTKEDFDFIIYSEVKELNNKDNVCKRIFKDFPNNIKEFQCLPVDYKFILSEIIVGDRAISVKFSDEKHNFFVVGNEFDYKFIHYYLTTYHATEIADVQDKDIKEFKIKVLDNNVTEKVFTHENILKIEA